MKPGANVVRTEAANKLFDELIPLVGRGSELAQQAGPALTRALRSVDSDCHAFEQWAAAFGQSGGFEKRLEKTKPRVLVKLARDYGLTVDDLTPGRLLFAIHTWLAIVVKFAVVEFVVDPGDARELSGEVVESGVPFRNAGIANFPDDSLLNWYLAADDGELMRVVDRLRQRLRHAAENARESSDPGDGNDLWKPLVHQALPREVRHACGEFYTPDWLADHVLDQSGYDGRSDTRLLDPACGSGTFLIRAIRRLVEQTNDVADVVNGVVGIDLNPLAVLAARSNYLLAIRRLLKPGEPVRIPVERADSILDEKLAKRVGSFDVIAGNPPWVGWETMSDDYRERTLPLWHRYGLFPFRGMASILGSGKKDLSMLMSYAVSDRYLKPGGKLAFVITQSVFKTAAGVGFRKFRIDDQPLRVLRVDDMTRLQPFDDAGTRTSTFVWQKGEATQYPVAYHVWQKSERAQVPLTANPVDPENPTSAWLAARPEALEVIRKLLGPSPYRAHEGVNTGGANAVYWVDVLSENEDGTLTVRNIVKGAKRKVDQIEARVEPDLVFPLLRGVEVRRWQANPTASIILVQDCETRRGIPISRMEQEFPLTLAWLRRFEPALRSRAAFRRYFTRTSKGQVRELGPFYSMFDVGTYTLLPYKVVWHRMMTPIAAAVSCPVGVRPVLPQETHVFVPCQAEDEAWYLAGMLNSGPFNFAALAYSQAGGKSFGSPHLLTNLFVPQFDETQSSHRRVSEIARRRDDVELDLAACTVWGIDDQHLRVIHQNWEELQGGP